MTPDPMIDKLGRQIQIGDTVVWATYTRESGLQLGKVIGFPVKTEKKQVWDSTTRTYNINVAHTTKIQVETEKSRYNYTTGTHDMVKEKRTLDGPSRFAVVTPLGD